MRLSTEAPETILKRSIIIAIFASVAVVLGLVETLIPVNFQIPGAKLGLGNIMVLACLTFFRGRDAFALIVLKTVLTAFLLGSFSSFLFSFFGGVFSFVVMYGLIKIGRHHFSLIGVSTAGGIAHNIGQLTAAMIVLGTSKIFYYLPFLMLTGIVTGIFVGLATRYLVTSLRKVPLMESVTVHNG